MVESTKDKEVLLEHSRDISVFSVVPEEVFYPKSTEEVQVILKKAEIEKKTVTVRAGGTCMSGGSLNDGFVINFTRHMAHIGEVKEVQGMYTIEVEMGVMYRDLEKKADESGLVLGSYTSSKDICGVGGMIGNNASGEKSVRLGATIDNVLGLEVVLADGTLIRTGALENTGESLKSILKTTELKKELLLLHQSLGQKLHQAIGRVPKVASGYRLERITKDGGHVDLTPIFVGAQGTLGVITRAVLKLTPKPVNTELVVISVDELSKLPAILKTVMMHRPEGVETFDINTFDRARNVLQNEYQICSRFFGDDTTLVVLAQFSENTETETYQTVLACEQDLKSQNIRYEIVSEKEVFDSVWKIRRSSFTLMKDNNPPGTTAVPCIEDIIVPIDKFDVFVPSLISILEKYHITYGFHGHIGDESLRIVPIFDLKIGREEVIDSIIAFTREVLTLVKSLEGNMSADHSDGIIRTPFIKEFYGEEIYDVFKKVKNLFDPNDVLNKNKKVNGTENHIKKYFMHY